MSQGFTIYPIAHIRTDFKEKFGIPRQSGRVETLGKIVFEPKYRSPEALRGIESFSHLWLIFDFSLAHRDEFSPTVRPPRLGGNTRVGVFASRSPFRPNAMGLSSVRLVAVEHSELMAIISWYRVLIFWTAHRFMTSSPICLLPTAIPTL